MTPKLAEIATPPPAVTELIAVGLDETRERMRSQLVSDLPPVQELCEHLDRYRGKMLRPTLVFVAAMTVDPFLRIDEARFDRLVTVAAVLETIHLATLVHDDVLDEAVMRRSTPTINAMHGNEAAVVLGDFLISRAFQLCSSLEEQRTAMRVGEITSRVCEGEILQLSRRDGRPVSRATYEAIIDRKTAALIAVACELGAVHARSASSAGAEDAPERLYRFGRQIGMAFQIQDDLLDLVGDEEVVGKSLGRDLEMGKLTLPLIDFVERRPDIAPEMLARFRGGEPVYPAHRKALAKAITEAGSIQHARATAAECVREARALLAGLPVSPARDYLAALAGMVVARSA